MLRDQDFYEGIHVGKRVWLRGISWFFALFPHVPSPRDYSHNIPDHMLRKTIKAVA